MREKLGAIISFLQIALTILAFYYIISIIDGGSIISAGRNLGIDGIIIIIFLFFIQFTLVALRIIFIASHIKQPIGVWLSMQSVMVGAFIGQTPLTAVGGDAARIVLLSRKTFRLRDAATIITVDRAIGLFGLLLLNIFSSIWLLQILDESHLKFGVATIVFGGLCVCIAPFGIHYFPSYVQKLKPIAWILDTLRIIRDIMLKKGAAAYCIGLSLLAHFINILIFYFIMHRIGQDISLFNVVILFSFPLLVGLLPISVGGWGVREGTVVLAFGLIGVANEAALTGSIIYGLGLLLVSLSGGGVWVVEILRKQSTKIPRQE